MRAEGGWRVYDGSAATVRFKADWKIWSNQMPGIRLVQALKAEVRGIIFEP